VVLRALEFARDYSATGLSAFIDEIQSVIEQQPRGVLPLALEPATRLTTDARACRALAVGSQNNLRGSRIQKCRPLQCGQRESLDPFKVTPISRQQDTADI
jgi:hypothetical protein